MSWKFLENLRWPFGKVAGTSWNRDEEIELDNFVHMVLAAEQNYSEDQSLYAPVVATLAEKAEEWSARYLPNQSQSPKTRQERADKALAFVRALEINPKTQKSLYVTQGSDLEKASHEKFCEGVTRIREALAEISLEEAADFSIRVFHEYGPYNTAAWRSPAFYETVDQVFRESVEALGRPNFAGDAVKRMRRIYPSAFVSYASRKAQVADLPASYAALQF